MDEMMEWDEPSEIPDGVVRMEALAGALKTCTPGEDGAVIMSRVRLYYEFLKEKRQHGGGWIN